MEELVESTYNQIRTYQEELAGAQSQESQLLTEIEQQNEEINSLLRQAKEEEAAAQLAAQKAAEEKAAQEAAAKEAQEEAARQAAERSTAGCCRCGGGGDERKFIPGQLLSERRIRFVIFFPEAGKPELRLRRIHPSDSSTQSSADTSQGKYLGRFKLTAYCTCSICCGSWAGGGTASGTTPHTGKNHRPWAGVPLRNKADDQWNGVHSGGPGNRLRPCGYSDGKPFPGAAVWSAVRRCLSGKLTGTGSEKNTNSGYTEMQKNPAVRRVFSSNRSSPFSYLLHLFLWFSSNFSRIFTLVVIFISVLLRFSCCFRACGHSFLGNSQI